MPAQILFECQKTPNWCKFTVIPPVSTNTVSFPYKPPRHKVSLSGARASREKQKERGPGCGRRQHSQSRDPGPLGGLPGCRSWMPGSDLPSPPPAWHRSLHPPWASLNKGVFLGTLYPQADSGEQLGFCLPCS